MLWLLLSCVHAPAAPPETHTLELPAPIQRQGLSSELIIEGPLVDRLSPDDGADLVILYGGEERGDMDHCGCPQRPRGGLGRQQSYLGAVQERGEPVIFVNGGYWLEDAMGLDGNPRADIPAMNQWMVMGMEQLGPHALNIGYNDTAGLTSMGSISTVLPLVSANIRGESVKPWVVQEIDGLRVGITGISVSGLSFLETPGFEIGDPFRQGRQVLEEMAAETDLVVLLAFREPKAARKLAQTGLVDVVIDTNLHRESYPPVFVGEALWVRSHFQSMRLGELRLGLDEGEIQWAVERKIDLDLELPPHPEQTTLLRAASDEVKAIQLEAFGREL
jgi:2',3'-cyclic-nucleotide 2'-phosphodiesterase (5'-nucleotidase family)